jgi:oxygen-independent coproporphyrinogen III oxidase
MSTESPSTFGIYIHVPFCKQACSYCDFYFVTKTDLLQAYIDRLLYEIDHSLKSFGRDRKLQTIYFGGGTPSRLGLSDLDRILSRIDTIVGLDDVREITFEANPDDIKKEYLIGLKQIGITRLSLGIQSFDPALLKFMHRAHSRDEAKKSLALIKEAGFKTFTCDLIYGNPNQSLKSLQQDLDTLLSFNPPHVSAYALTIEPATRLGKYQELGRLNPLDDDKVVEHMNTVADSFRAHGILRYEVSNFALEGHESVHNSNYWNHTPYLGLGPGAHSMDYKTNKAGTILEGFRSNNVPDLKKYCTENFGKGGIEHLTPEQMTEERLLMGLRTRDGVTLIELKNRYGYVLSNRQIEWINTSNKIELSESISIPNDNLPVADHLILELISRR